MKTNWYKHVIIHFKHSIEVKFDLSSLKVCKRTQNDQKVSPKGVKITKSPVIQQLCQFESKNWQKHENLLIQTCYNTFQALYRCQI